MEESFLSSIIQYFFQFGPFAILPYLIFYALPKLYKQLKKEASKDVKTVLKRNILIYQVISVFLIVFCVGFWAFSLSEISYYYGEIINLKASGNTIESRHLYLKKTIVDGDYIVEWIWKKEKDDRYIKIKLTLDDEISGGSRSEVFYCPANELKKRDKCIFEFSKDDGILLYNGKPLAKTFTEKIARPGKVINSSTAYLYAGPVNRKFLTIPEALDMLQALDSEVRDQAVDIIIEEAFKNKPMVEQLLHEGFQNIYQQKMDQSQIKPKTFLKYSLLTLLTKLSDQWCTQYNRWKEILGGEIIDHIVEEANNKDRQIKSLAINFLQHFKKEVTTEIEQKWNSEEYNNRINYLRGAIEFYAQTPGLKTNLKRLRDISRTMNNQQIGKEINDLLNAQDFQLPGDLSGQRKQVLLTALKLMKESIRYKWGGKNPAEGFDSSGFIAYILGQAGLLKNPGTWWSGKFREQMGTLRAEKTPKKPGDLVFYTHGYVMLYLGDSKIIGMTPIGIVITHYKFFLASLIQVNDIDYH
jgi:hypothetical protein